MRGIGRHPSERTLSLLAGGDLGAGARWLAARHLERCPQCGESLAAFVRDRAELRPGPPVAEPDFGALAHRARVEAEQVPRRTPLRSGWLPKGAAAAGLAAVALAIFLFGRGGNPDPPATARTGAPPPASRLPLAYRGAETQVTAGGGLSVRAFHAASGTLTVTEYYAP